MSENLEGLEKQMAVAIDSELEKKFPGI